MLTPSEVLYMEDGGPKRCNRCAHFISIGQCELFRQQDKVSGADGVCGLYINGRPITSGTQPVRFIGLDPRVADYGADKGVGGYACGNCRYGGGFYCGRPSLAELMIDNGGGCCNLWDYPKGWPIKPPASSEVTF